MTTPSISAVPLPKPLELSAYEKKNKELAVRLKPHMLFKPSIPRVENIQVFTDPNQVK